MYKFKVYINWQAALKSLDELPEPPHDASTATLYVECTMSQFTEPIANILYWPVGNFRLSQVKHLHDTEARNTGNSYSFSSKTGIVYHLRDRGQTKPDFSIEIEIPKPKGKTEMRYHNGRWEKFLKSKGWVNA